MIHKSLPNSTIYPSSEGYPGYPIPHLFGSSHWINLLNIEYNIEFYLMRHDDGKSFFHFADIEYPGFQKIVSLPFCDYLIPSIECIDSLDEMISDLQEAFPSAKIECKWILPNSESEENLSFQYSQTAYLHTVPTPDYQSVWKSMDSSFRGKVRQAKRHDLKTEICHKLYSVKQFYDSYHELRVQKFSKIPQSFSLFKNIRERFFKNNSGFVLKVKLDDTSIAFAICLEFGEKIYFKYSCSKKEYLDFRPNNLLLNELFRYACENNFNAVDLGLSGMGKQYEGLVRFKESMGAKASPIYKLEIVPDQFNSEAEKKLSDLMTSLTETIVQHDPAPEVTSKLSERIYPYFA